MCSLERDGQVETVMCSLERDGQVETVMCSLESDRGGSRGVQQVQMHLSE